MSLSPAAAIRTLIGLAILVQFVGAQAVTEVQKLTASDPSGLAGFGRAVSISGDLALVTAAAANDVGAAYVFEWDGSTWSEQQKLTASDAALADQFGWSGVIGVDFIAIGAHWDDDLGGQSGSVYIFRYDGAEWVEDEKLNPTDGAAGDEFGYSMATQGELLVVSAPSDDDQGTESGSTYVFRWNGTSWDEEQKLVASNAGAQDRVGWSTALDGDVFVVTTVEDLSQAGSATVFRYDGVSWTEETQLTASDGAAGDWFGWGVDVEGDVMVVGANHADSPGFDSGAAYVFRWSGSAWEEEQKIYPAVSQAYDAFGWSAAIQGDDLLVGAAGYENGDGDGAVYHFRYDGSQWIEEALFVASDPGGGFLDNLGFSVAVDGQHVLSGALWANAPGASDAGAAYYYQLIPTSGILFRRGDSNLDGAHDISDAVLSLSALFVPGALQPVCLDATDSNDDGAFDISDPVHTLSALFIPGSPPPPPPGPFDCGADPTDDGIDCSSYDVCP